MQIAATSLFLSLFILNGMKSVDVFWTKTLEHYTSYTSKDLISIRKRLAFLVINAKDSELKSVYMKHSRALSGSMLFDTIFGLKIDDISNLS